MKALLLLVLIVLGVIIYNASKGPVETRPSIASPANQSPRSELPASASPPQAVMPRAPDQPKAKGWAEFKEDESTATRGVAAAREAAFAGLAEKSPEFRGLRANVPKLKETLDSVRKTGSTTEKLQASEEYNKARLRLAAMEAECLAANDGVKAADSRLKTAQRELEKLERESRRVETEKAEAEAARQARIAEMSKPLVGRLNVGDVGVLPAFKVLQVIAADKVIVETENGDDLMLDGFGTGTMVDGRSYRLNSPAKIDGTVRYKTVIGGSKTVLRAVPAQP